MTVGAVEDGVRATSLVDAQTRMELLRVSGYRAVRITSYWTPGHAAPTDNELAILENVAGAAERNGVRLYVTVMVGDGEPAPCFTLPSVSG